MDDNTQQPEQPIQPDPLQQPSTFSPVVMPKNKLDELPVDIKYDLDALLKRDGNVNKAKSTIENKWLGKTDVLPASYATYRSYYDLHRLRLHKEKEDETLQLQKTKQELLGLNDLVSDITNGKDVSFRSKYQEILDLIEDRIAAIVEIQSHSFSSPQYEMVMVQLAKAKKEILEKMEDYKDVVDEQRHAKNVAFFESFSYELMLTAINVYKKVNGDNRLAEFRAELKAEVPKIVERTQTNYNRDLNDL